MLDGTARAHRQDWREPQVDVLRKKRRRRLAIARALVKIGAELRAGLKEKGLMRRDPRMKERKKPGQPGARKRFQFSKR